MSFQNDLQNRWSEFKLLLQNINVQKKMIEMNAYVGVTPQFFLYDSTLLYLAFRASSLGTCALIKQYAKHFHA